MKGNGGLTAANTRICILLLTLAVQCMYMYSIITINEPVDYMAQAVMILMQAKTLRGQLEGVGPENRDFLGA